MVQLGRSCNFYWCIDSAAQSRYKYDNAQVVMRLLRATLVILYLVLLCWWVAINLLGVTSGAGNTLFNLAVGFYTFAFSVATIWFSVSLRNRTSYSSSVLVSAIGMAMFGIGSMFWFYYDFMFGNEIPFPSMSDLFYVLQFPFTVLGLFLLTFALRMYSDFFIYKVEAFIKMCLFVLLVAGLASLITKYIGLPGDYLSNLLLTYFPVESFSILVLTVFILASYVEFFNSYDPISLLIIVFGQCFWVAADSLFFYGINTATFFNASLADIMFLTGVFLIILGWLRLLQPVYFDNFHSENPGIYFERISYFRPVSLN